MLGAVISLLIVMVLFTFVIRFCKNLFINVALVVIPIAILALTAAILAGSRYGSMFELNPGNLAALCLAVVSTFVVTRMLYNRKYGRR